MGIDSSTDLLFRVLADSSDAEGNIGRFRTLLSKDLGAMEAEFGNWASKTFGSFATVKGATLGLAAATGAGLLAVGAAANHAIGKYAEYVSEVAHGSQVTGIGITQMSHLAVAADNTRTPFEAL